MESPLEGAGFETSVPDYGAVYRGTGGDLNSEISIDSQVDTRAHSRSLSSFFFRVPEKTPRTVCRCQPVALATSSTVAPAGRRNIAITASCFDGRFASDWGSGNVSIADHSFGEGKIIRGKLFKIAAA
jgi:hypothetical protein